MLPGDDYQIVADTVDNGVRHITAIPSKLVCSKLIDFDLEEGKIHNLKYLGGCNGNLKAISKLVNGMTVDQIEGYLLGNTCGPRPTSCADQLAKAVRAAYDETHAA